MVAKLNHLAIMSEKYALAIRFYEAIFGMRLPAKSRLTQAGTVGDGYVGMNINPRKVGRPARLDHFGIEVDDIEMAFERLRRDYPTIGWVKRPPTRPFASTTTHDPDGNVFDLSQKTASNRNEIYAEEHALTPRHVEHFAIRTLNPGPLAEFYAKTFDLGIRPTANGDRNHYVTDGHITMVLMPWHITDYEGTGIVSPSLDHIGFVVEDLAAFNDDVERIAGGNPWLAPFPLGSGPEAAARLELARKSCPLCRQHLADVDGVLLSVREAQQG